MSGILMLWKEIEGDQHLFVGTSPDGNGFDPPRKLPESFLTSQRPALTVFRGRLFMAWKGVQEDPQQHLFLSSSSDGVNFDGPHMLSGMNSSEGPALTVFNDRLFIAFKGSGGNQRLFLASSADGVKFDGPHARVDQITSQGPALTTFNQRMFMAWKTEGDQLGGQGSGGRALPMAPTLTVPTGMTHSTLVRDPR